MLESKWNDLVMLFRRSSYTWLSFQRLPSQCDTVFAKFFRYLSTAASDAPRFPLYDLRQPCAALETPDPETLVPGSVNSCAREPLVSNPGPPSPCSWPDKECREPAVFSANVFKCGKTTDSSSRVYLYLGVNGLVFLIASF